MNWRRIIAAIMGMVLLVGLVPVIPAAAAEQCFAETNKCVGERFYQYWLEHGGLVQQGLPLTNAFSEVVTAPGPLKGKSITVQYFERARFEYHPEIADPKFQVLLGLVGTEQFAAKYPAAAPSKGTGCVGNEPLFTGEKYCVAGNFAEYWRTHGGLAQQGYPISKAFVEKNPFNGVEYAVQYFERARFEYHPENDPTNQVLLGLLGGEQFTAKYPGGEPKAAPAPPAAPPAGSAIPLIINGTGNKTTSVNLPAGLLFATEAYSGKSNFIVWLKDRQGNDVDLLANEIGPVSGMTRAANIPTTAGYLLEVKASGPWSITLLAPREVELQQSVNLPQKFTGQGTKVSKFFYARQGALFVRGSQNGKSNFIVWVLDANGEMVGLAANEIGNVAADKVIHIPRDGIYFVSIQADGAWALDVTQ